MGVSLLPYGGQLLLYAPLPNLPIAEHVQRVYFSFEANFDIFAPNPIFGRLEGWEHAIFQPSRLPIFQIA
jgi:hypothetical protein